MPTVDIVDLKNKKVGSLDLADAVFGAEVNQDLIYQAVHNFRASQRAGTHKTKTRAEVSGSGRKLWRQKGTGRARVGSIRSPLWRHGGTVHGPQPRDYSYRMPKKMLLGAIRSALSARLADGAIKVVQSFDLEGHKTRGFSEILGALETGTTVLLVEDNDNRNLELSSRNLPGVTLMKGRDLHPYHLLGHELVIFSRAAAEKCSEVLA
jgi:large subunit ribosomal protein L4